MKSDVYWMKRSLANSAKTINLTEAKIKVLEREYKRALKTIQKQVEDFYKKYAGETGLSLVEAKKALSKRDVNLTLKEYRELVEKTNDPVAQALLNKFSKKQRITRLQALRLQIEKEVTKLYEQEEIITHDTLGEVYKNTYYRNIYEIQKGLGFGVSFSKLDTRAIEIAINTAWSGSSYSEIIWGKHRKQLAKNVEQIITQGVILGESNDKMAIKLQRAMGSSFNNAKRLIRTESNYVHNKATMKSYEEMGQDEYKYLATLDLRTSEICASLDGKRFKIPEAQVGRNYPPMHPNCRSTTIPVVDYEDLEPETRLAKHDGKYYKVPADMTYQEWYNKYVNNIDISSKLKEMKISGKVIPTQRIEIEDIRKHAFKRFEQRNIKKDDAQQFIDESILCLERWDGKQLCYYSLKGAAYINQEGQLQTAFSSKEYDEKIIDLMGVLRRGR